jgi:hypothetical protein
MAILNANLSNSDMASRANFVPARIPFNRTSSFEPITSIMFWLCFATLPSTSPWMNPAAETEDAVLRNSSLEAMNICSGEVDF